MSLMNRVNPFGELFETPAKGLFMGNRGILHDKEGELTSKRWAHKSWVTCALNFKDYKRTPKKRNPSEYTELFFLDEATAMAAGHRPCGQCRYKDFVRFIECWAKGNGLSDSISVKDVDTQLHKDRVTRSREKVIRSEPIDDMPDGVFIELADEPGTAWLLWNGELLKWQEKGYGERRKRQVGLVVRVLTPESNVNAIAEGYRPHVHHNK